MEINFTQKAEEDFRYWKKTNNVIILKKVRKLLESILESPYEGIGKPEALKHTLTGAWSRRIDKEHRLVYELIDDEIFVISIRGHY